MADPGSTTEMPAVSPQRRVHPLWVGVVLAALMVLGSPALVAGLLTGQTVAPAKPSQSAPPAVAPLGDLAADLFPDGAGWLVHLVLHFAAALLLYRALLSIMPRAARKAVGMSFDIVAEKIPTRPEISAALGAAFFFFHPIHVETLAAAGALPGLLALCFGLLAWALLVCAGPGEERPFVAPDWLRWSAGWLAFAAAVACHPQAIGLAPLLVLAQLFWSDAAWGARIACALLVALPAAGIALLQPDAGGTTGPAGLAWALSGLHRIGVYAQWTLAPFDLDPERLNSAVSGLADARLWGGAGWLLIPLLLCWWAPVERRRLKVLLPAALLLGPAAVPFLPGGTGPGMMLAFLLPLAAAFGALILEAFHYRSVFVERAGTGLARLGGVLAVLVCAALGALSLQRSRGGAPEEEPQPTAEAEPR